MTEAEKVTYEFLLKALREGKSNEMAFHLDKLERLVEVVNIRINKAVPEGWELP